MMKIALAQLNYQVGKVAYNMRKIIDTLQKAKVQQVDLLVFSELCLCGYPALDLLESKKFLSLCEDAVGAIANICTDIACIIGAPCKNTRHIGKALFNAAYFIEHGSIKAVVHKALLPNYDVFDECRYFEFGTTFSCVDFKDYRIALTICEDLWNTADRPPYSVRPMDQLIQQKPDILINIAASPFSYHHEEERIRVLMDNTQRYHLPLFYVNQVGAQTELIFDGGSLVLDTKGTLLDKLPLFEEAFGTYTLYKAHQGTLSIHRDCPIPHPLSRTKDADERTAQVYRALVLGIKDYFEKSGLQRAVLGLSGGIDSAVACVLAVAALSPERVLAVLLPGPYTSQSALRDANDLIKRLRCLSTHIAIHDIYKAFQTALIPQFKGNSLGGGEEVAEEITVTEENIQSRTRAVLLMAMANKMGYILLNTSNKSEVAVGYGTLYGDLCGALSILGDVYKTQVYQLAAYINREQEIIPGNVLKKPPSAELRPHQKDSDTLPEYTILDPILEAYMEKKQSIEEIVVLGYDLESVQYIIQLVHRAEYKRFQMPPILRVSDKAFGWGRRMPITNHGTIL